MSEIEVNADLAFGPDLLTLDASQLRSLYAEALHQIRWARRMSDEYRNELDRVGWENVGLRADVEKLRRHRDMLVVRLAEKSGASEA